MLWSRFVGSGWLRVSHAQTETESDCATTSAAADAARFRYLKWKRGSPEIRRSASCSSSTPDLNSRAECGRAGVAGEDWAKATIRLHRRSCVHIGLWSNNPENAFRRSDDRNRIGCDKAALGVIAFAGMLVM